MNLILYILVTYLLYTSENKSNKKNAWYLNWLINWLVFNDNFSSISAISWRKQMLLLTKTPTRLRNKTLVFEFTAIKQWGNTAMYIHYEWLLFNTNSTIFQLYHGEYKLIFNDMMMRSALYLTNMLS